MVVATQHAEAQRQRARQRMKERFLLDRIALQRSDIALRIVECASLIEPNFADTRPAVENDAPMAAREASHAVVVQLLVESAFNGTLCKNVFEAGGFSSSFCQLLPPEIVLVSPNQSTPCPARRRVPGILVSTTD